MPIEWEKGSDKEHKALEKKTSTKDPVWNQIMAELAAGNVVKVKYSDDKERGTLARSIGRRAAHMGFKVDQRRGEGYLSIQRVAESKGAE